MRGREGEEEEEGKKVLMSACNWDVHVNEEIVSMSSFLLSRRRDWDLHFADQSMDANDSAIPSFG